MNMIMKHATSTSSSGSGALQALKSKYVRLKEILSILTTESSSNSGSSSSTGSGSGLRLLSSQDVGRIESLRVDFKF